MKRQGSSFLWSGTRPAAVRMVASSLRCVGPGSANIVSFDRARAQKKFDSWSRLSYGARGRRCRKHSLNQLCGEYNAVTRIPIAKPQSAATSQDGSKPRGRLEAMRVNCRRGSALTVLLAMLMTALERP